MCVETIKIVTNYFDSSSSEVAEWVSHFGYDFELIDFFDYLKDQQFTYKIGSLKVIGKQYYSGFYRRDTDLLPYVHNLNLGDKLTLKTFELMKAEVEELKNILYSEKYLIFGYQNLPIKFQKLKY